MKNTYLLLLALISLCISCVRIGKLGFVDRVEYRLYKEFPVKSCGLVELCFNEEEASLWEADSKGKSGDRKKLLLEYGDSVLLGEFNGISRDCLIRQLGKATDTNGFFEPQDSVFVYTIYKSRASQILLRFNYNLAMDKVIESQLDYFYFDELPVPSALCPEIYFSKTDSILARKYLMDFPKSRRREEAERYEEIKKELIGQSINCYMCYKGPPTYFWIGKYRGIYAKDSRFLAVYKYPGGSELEIGLSPDSAKILSYERFQVWHDR